MKVAWSYRLLSLLAASAIVQSLRILTPTPTLAAIATGTVGLDNTPDASTDTRVQDPDFHTLATPTPTQRCPVAFAPCPAPQTGCCFIHLATIFRTFKPLPTSLSTPTIEAQAWVDFICPPTGDSACGVRNYYFWIGGRGFTESGHVIVQFGVYPDPQGSPQGGFVATYNATGPSFGISTPTMRGEYVPCRLKGFVEAVDEATGRKSNRIDALITFAGYQNAC